MNFFTSGTFWFIEGILCCMAFAGFYFWIKDKGIKLLWWKWLLLVLWILFFGFTISFVTTSLGEREKVAAFKGAIIFGLISVIGFVALLRVLGFLGKTKT